MAVTEQSRHHMIETLTETLGQEDAMTLVDHLPPVGWADVATKIDLGHLEQRMDQQFTAVNAEFAQLEQRMDHRFSTVNAEFAQLEERMDLRFSAIHAEFGTNRAESRGEFAAIRFEIQAAVSHATHSTYVAFVSTMIGFGGVLIAAGIFLQR